MDLCEMAAPAQDDVADLRRRIAELEQKLQAGFAERDGIIAQQTAELRDAGERHADAEGVGPVAG